MGSSLGPVDRGASSERGFSSNMLQELIYLNGILDLKLVAGRTGRHVCMERITNADLTVAIAPSLP